jgi:Trm5-related predicted tRNA methylase
VDVYRRLETMAEVIGKHIDSPFKRKLVAEYLESLARKGELSDRERIRLTSTVLGGPER